MNGRRPSRIVLAEHRGSRAQQLEFCAIVNLGIVQSLASGALAPAEAVRRFYHAQNCMFARQTLRSRDANEVMSRGVQLPDIFEALNAEEAQRECYQELEAIRGLCLKVLVKGRPLRRMGNSVAA